MTRVSNVQQLDAATLLRIGLSAGLIMLSAQFLLAAGYLFAAPAFAQVATAIDGDILKIGGISVRGSTSALKWSASAWRWNLFVPVATTSTKSPKHKRRSGACRVKKELSQ